MGPALLAISTVLYLGVMVAQGIKADYPTALVFLGYSIANVGLVWGMLR